MSDSFYPIFIPYKTDPPPPPPKCPHCGKELPEEKSEPLTAGDWVVGIFSIGFICLLAAEIAFGLIAGVRGCSDADSNQVFRGIGIHSGTSLENTYFNKIIFTQYIGLYVGEELCKTRD